MRFAFCFMSFLSLILKFRRCFLAELRYITLHGLVRGYMFTVLVVSALLAVAFFLSFSTFLSDPSSGLACFPFRHMASALICGLFRKKKKVIIFPYGRCTFLISFLLRSCCVWLLHTSP